VGAGVGSGVGCALGMLEGEGLGPAVGEAVGSGVGCELGMLGEELAAVVGGPVDILWIIRSSSSQNSEISSISASSLVSALELPARPTCNLRFSGILFRIHACNPSALHHLGKRARRRNASSIACLIIMLVIAFTRTHEDDEASDNPETKRES